MSPFAPSGKTGGKTTSRNPGSAASTGGAGSQSGGDSAGNDSGGGTTGMSGPVPLLGPDLLGPRTIQVGYRADAAAAFSPAFASVTVTLQNQGAGPSEALTFALQDGSEFSLSTQTLPALAAASEASLQVVPHIAAGKGERVVSDTLLVTAGSATARIPIYATIGDPDLAASINFANDAWAIEATADLPRAPHPQLAGSAHPEYGYVYMGVPANLRQAASVDVLIALHGFNATLAATIPAKKYVQLAAYANRNAILIVPQGLYDQAADDFGALRQPGGVNALISEVLIVLNRAGLLDNPVLGRVAISSHSGGYSSLSDMLVNNGVAGGLSGVYLLDSLYGDVANYRAWVDTKNGAFVSSFQASSGDSVVGQSATLKSDLQSDGFTTLAEDGRPREEDLLQPIVFHTVHAAHDQIPDDYYALGEYWRYSGLAPRLSPMPILRRASLQGGTLHLQWFAEPSDDPRSFSVQISADGSTFSELQALSPEGVTLSADLPAAPTSFWVKLIASYDGLPDSLPSDTYFVSEGPAKTALVVDAFDRCLDQDMKQMSHDFAARLGADLPNLAVETCTNEWVERGECSLAGHALVVWVAGTSGEDNHSINANEAPLVAAYVSGGGKFLATGAELAYAMNLDGLQSFMSSTLGISAFTDSSGSSEAFGAGSLAAQPLFFFGQADTYAAPTPDTFTPKAGFAALLTYGTPQAPLAIAAIGNGQVVDVGFPLETITPAATRTAIVQALVNSLNP